MTTPSDTIGLIGGTFNPVHYGHLRAAEEIAEQFQIDNIIFVPSNMPPHKNNHGIAPPEHRLRMVQLAVAENNGFSVSDFEIAQKGTSYSIYTIEHFRNRLGPGTRLFFLMGTDSFAEIPSWKDYIRLFSLTNLIIMSRPGFPGQNPAAILPVDVAENFDYNSSGCFFEHSSGRRLYFQNITLLEISSSAIRDNIKQRKSVRYLLPPEVQTYIQKHRLYEA